MLLLYMKKSLQTSFFPFWFLSFITIALFLFLSSTNSFSLDLTLIWNRNTKDGIAGYKIFSHEAGQDYNYDEPFWEGTNTSCSITDLDPNITYYFVARSFDILDQESSNSNEVILSNGMISGSVDSGINSVGGCFIVIGDNDSQTEKVLGVLKDYFIDFFTSSLSP